MIVVSDTSPLTALLQINQGDLLFKLFDRVCVPEAVQQELLKYHKELPAWLEVKSVEDLSLVSSFKNQLDVGESEAIVLALEIKPDRLLIDERKGRLLASASGIPIIGLVGAIIMARRKGLINSAARILNELESVAGFYLHANVKKRALEAAGESA